MNDLSTKDAKFAGIYDRHYGDIYSYCLRRTDRDLVEDVVANVFLTVWRKIEEVPGGPDALFWMYRVAYRNIGNQWRGMARRHRLESKLRGLGRDLPIPPEDFVVQNEEARLMLEAITRLPDRSRSVAPLPLGTTARRRYRPSARDLGRCGQTTCSSGEEEPHP